MKESKSIKIYNVRDYIESIQIDGKRYTVPINTEVAIIEGKNGVIIIDGNGNGGVYEDTEVNYTIPLEPYEEKGTKIYCRFPDLTYEMPIKNMIEKIPYEEKTILEYMDNWKYKRPVMYNLLDILDFIKKIGLISSQYCTKKYVRENYKGFY